MHRTFDIKDMAVMSAKCSTCPFRTDKKGRYHDPELTVRIMTQVISTESQICHHPRLSGKKQTHLCRGARDYQLDIFYRLGLIAAPTDAAWQEAYEKIKEPQR